MTISASCGIFVESPPNLAEFTKNVVINKEQGSVTGDGIFDDLMETATKHIVAQFESNRIRNEDYATAYIQLYQETLQEAFQIWSQKCLNDAQIKAALEEICIKQKELALQRKASKCRYRNKQKQLELMERQTDADIALKEKQLNLLEQQIKAEDAKTDLYRRQIEGFDEDYKNKRFLKFVWMDGL